MSHNMVIMVRVQTLFHHLESRFFSLIQYLEFPTYKIRGYIVSKLLISSFESFDKTLDNIIHLLSQTLFWSNYLEF